MSSRSAVSLLALFAAGAACEVARLALRTAAQLTDATRAGPGAPAQRRVRLRTASWIPDRVSGNIG